MQQRITLVVRTQKTLTGATTEMWRRLKDEILGKDELLQKDEWDVTVWVDSDIMPSAGYKYSFELLRDARGY